MCCCAASLTNVQLNGIMKTLFTAKTISKNGCLETSPTPTGLRKANLENPRRGSASVMPLSWSSHSCWSVMRHDESVLMTSQLG
jgi:hypothetical protein